MTNLRTLNLSEMLFTRRGNVARTFVQFAISLALRLFFRRIEVTDGHRVPLSGPLILVLNHPNGLIDAALVLCAMPRRISFLAKSTLFRIPGVNYLLRAFEVLPLYRRVDSGEETSRNLRTFEACFELLKRGGAIALFPEGISHDLTRLMPIKTGAARIALGAISRGDDKSRLTHSLRIVPIGIFYTSKSSLRSEALLRVGEPFTVEPGHIEDDGQPAKEDVRELSERIRAELESVTLNADDITRLRTIRRAGQILASVSAGLDVQLPLARRFDLLQRSAKIFGVGRPRNTGMLSIQARLESFENKLNDSGLETETLSLAWSSIWAVSRYFLFRIFLLIVFAPLALIGGLLHSPAYTGATVLASVFRRHGADEAYATVRILASLVLVPLTWSVFAILTLLIFNWKIALISLPVIIFSGYVAMRWVEIAVDLRPWLRAVFFLIRRRREFLELLIERRELLNDLHQLGHPFADH